MPTTSMSRLFVCLFLFIAVTISVSAQCDAGSDATVALCADGDIVELFDLLGSNPDGGGEWINSADAPFSGIFDPASDGAGAFRYVLSTDASGAPCTNPDTSIVTIVITAIPQVNIQLDNTSGCGTASVNFSSSTVAPGFPTWRWNFGNGESSLDPTPFHTYRDTGCFVVSLTLMSANGCVATDTLFDAVCVDFLPTAQFSLLVDPVRTNAPTAIFINESSGADDYDWEIPGVGNYGSFAPEVLLPEYVATYYACLEAVTDEGCVDRFCRNVNVREPTDIFVPSAFTADRNKVNDQFLPILTFDPDFYELLIFDRHGGLVFETNKVSEGWTGRHLSSEFIVKDEEYHWHLKTIKGSSVIEMTGKVLMLR